MSVNDRYPYDTNRFVISLQHTVERDSRILNWHALTSKHTDKSNPNLVMWFSVTRVRVRVRVKGWSFVGRLNGTGRPAQHHRCQRRPQSHDDNRWLLCVWLIIVSFLHLHF